jgi:hypothetical protein
VYGGLALTRMCEPPRTRMHTRVRVRAFMYVLASCASGRLFAWAYSRVGLVSIGGGGGGGGERGEREVGEGGAGWVRDVFGGRVSVKRKTVEGAGHEQVVMRRGGARGVRGRMRALADALAGFGSRRSTLKRAPCNHAQITCCTAHVNFYRHRPQLSLASLSRNTALPLHCSRIR